MKKLFYLITGFVILSCNLFAQDYVNDFIKMNSFYLDNDTYTLDISLSLIDVDTKESELMQNSKMVRNGDLLFSESNDLISISKNYIQLEIDKSAKEITLIHKNDSNMFVRTMESIYGLLSIEDSGEDLISNRETTKESIVYKIIGSPLDGYLQMTLYLNKDNHSIQKIVFIPFEYTNKRLIVDYTTRTPTKNELEMSSMDTYIKGIEHKPTPNGKYINYNLVVI